MLGTVQLGLPYGIANRTGQPSYQEARDILACAYEGGVNCLDTAAIYGTSEEVLGRALAELGIAEEMTIVSKVHHMAQGLDVATAAAIVEESVVQSLKAPAAGSAADLSLSHRGELRATPRRCSGSRSAGWCATSAPR